MRIDVLTVFPEYLVPLRYALVGKAIERGHVAIGVHDLRAWATDAHKSVDDSPYGGGPGMVMKPSVLGPALDDVCYRTGPASSACVADMDSAIPHRNVPRHDEIEGIIPVPYGEREQKSEGESRPLLIVPTPTGELFTQAHAREWSCEKRIVFVCGRYEGIDQRVLDDAAARYRVREVSLGDYVLIGGEVAVLAITEALVRLIPGVLGNSRSHAEDSFSDGLLEGPMYTKPQSWRGRDVPAVLYSGDHGKVAAWRRQESLKRTRERRPDLLAAARAQSLLSRADEEFLAKS